MGSCVFWIKVWAPAGLLLGSVPNPQFLHGLHVGSWVFPRNGAGSAWVQQFWCGPHVGSLCFSTRLSFFLSCFLPLPSLPFPSLLGLGFLFLSFRLVRSFVPSFVRSLVLFLSVFISFHSFILSFSLAIVLFSLSAVTPPHFAPNGSSWTTGNVGS